MTTPITYLVKARMNISHNSKNLSTYRISIRLSHRDVCPWIDHRPVEDNLRFDEAVFATFNEAAKAVFDYIGVNCALWGNDYINENEDIIILRRGEEPNKRHGATHIILASRGEKGDFIAREDVAQLWLPTCF